MVTLADMACWQPLRWFRKKVRSKYTNGPDRARPGWTARTGGGLRSPRSARRRKFWRLVMHYMRETDTAEESELAPSGRGRCTGGSISKSITNVLLILLILLILRFPGSTAFCISASISTPLIVLGTRPLQVAMDALTAKSR